MKFKEYFVNDITYGMLVIGASMEEIFDHIITTPSGDYNSIRSNSTIW